MATKVHTIQSKVKKKRATTKKIYKTLKIKLVI